MKDSARKCDGHCGGLTDNPNRTFNDVRQCFTKVKAKIGTPRCRGVICLTTALSPCLREIDGAVQVEALMEGDERPDIECEDGNNTVFAPRDEFFKAKTGIIAGLGTWSLR